MIPGPGSRMFWVQRRNRLEMLDKQPENSIELRQDRTSARKESIMTPKVVVGTPNRELCTDNRSNNVHSLQVIVALAATITMM